jgi:hypothetical protein
MITNMNTNKCINKVTNPPKTIERIIMTYQQSSSPRFSKPKNRNRRLNPMVFSQDISSQRLKKLKIKVDDQDKDVTQSYSKFYDLGRRNLSNHQY